MLETAWESRWLPGLLKQQGNLLSYIKSPLKAAIIRGFSKLSFLMVERPDSNLKTSYSRELIEKKIS